MSEFTNEQKQPFLRGGRLVERAFASLLDNPQFSSSKEDQIEHWDVKFDVKGLKRVKRSDSETNEHIHWLEIKGITGHDGWCYGEADFFAFELTKYWIIVAKQDLQDFIKENVVKEFAQQPTLYKLYRRQGRQDIITMVTSYDLCFISSAILKKK
jgi:hypothetical protein